MRYVRVCLSGASHCWAAAPHKVLLKIPCMHSILRANQGLRRLCDICDISPRLEECAEHQSGHEELEEHKECDLKSGHIHKTQLSRRPHVWHLLNTGIKAECLSSNNSREANHKHITHCKMQNCNSEDFLKAFD